MADSEFIDLDQAAKMAGISLSTLNRYVKAGEFPPKIKISHQRRGISRSDFEEYTAAISIGKSWSDVVAGRTDTQKKSALVAEPDVLPPRDGQSIEVAIAEQLNSALGLNFDRASAEWAQLLLIATKAAVKAHELKPAELPIINCIASASHNGNLRLEKL